MNFLQQDLLTLDLAPATVVSCYLLLGSHLLIRDKLRSELQTGARLVTHSFDMGIGSQLPPAPYWM